MTNLRWNGQHLEGLFFVLVESDEEQTNLSLAITSAGMARTEPIAAVRPISEQKGDEIIATDPTWFSMQGDLRFQCFASRRTMTQLWLPVESGRAISFVLLHDGRTLAQQELTPSMGGPIWFHARLDAKAEDPWLHEQALFPHSSLMVQRGEPVVFTFDLVGAGPHESTSVSLATTVRGESAETALWQDRTTLVVQRQRMSHKNVGLPSTEWPPGSYVVAADLIDSAGKTVGSVKRGLVIVDRTPTEHRFGAVYADFSRALSVDANSQEESAYDRESRRYHSTHWGPHSDVMVSFAGTTDHLVFAHTNHAYTPFWYVNDLGITWEWVEGHDNELGSLEAPYDRECRYSRVSIVESTPARAIVHWRYNTTSRTYDRYFDEWVDEYYYAYPDQTVVREIRGFFRRHNWHETFEPILQAPAGLHVRESLEDEHISILNLHGDKLAMDPLNMWKNWTDRWEQFRQTDPQRTFIMRFNLRGGRKFFHAFADLRRVYSLWSQLIEDDNGQREGPAAHEVPYGIAYVGQPDEIWSRPNSYCLFDSQGALLEARSLPDRRLFTLEELEAETNNPMSQTKDMPDERVESTWAYLLDLGNQVDPIAITQSWVAPAVIDHTDGLEFAGYAMNDRAYHFTRTAGTTSAGFHFSPATSKAQVNPVFVLDRTSSQTAPIVSVNGKALDPPSVHIGFEAEPGGTFRTVVFLQLTLTEPASIRIETK